MNNLVGLVRLEVKFSSRPLLKPGEIEKSVERFTTTFRTGTFPLSNNELSYVYFFTCL